MSRATDTLIKGARIYDGSGGEPFLADIIVAEGLIDRIIPLPDSFRGSCARTIDARGLAAAPGFIDVHSHSEFTLLADPRAEGKISQGITTEINGNCGLSAAPLYGSALEHREADFRELGILERWSSFREYFDILEKRKPALNFATLAGHGNVRASVVGFENRAPEDAELRRMEHLLIEAVREGAIGLSSGLIYPPGVYAEEKELILLAGAINYCIYTTHMRSEGERLIESIEETIRVGMKSGIAVHVSHLKTNGEANWSKAERAISAIVQAREEGLQVTCDRYPYTASATDLDSVLPSWTYEGGSEEELKRLREPSLRKRVREEVLASHPRDSYWDSIIVSSVNSEKNRGAEGRSLFSLARSAGKDQVDFLIEFLIEEELRIGAIFHSMDEGNLVRFLSLPYLMIGSDSSARSFSGITHSGKPHPRGFGSFPRFLGRYAGDSHGIDLPEAIRKITSLPAEVFGLAGRGALREGYCADIVIFNEDTIMDRATYENPFLPPDGIAFVLVNGNAVVWEGALTGASPGRVLRYGSRS